MSFPFDQLYSFNYFDIDRLQNYFIPMIIFAFVPHFDTIISWVVE